MECGDGKELSIDGRERRRVRWGMSDISIFYWIFASYFDAVIGVIIIFYSSRMQLQTKPRFYADINKHMD